MRGLARKPNVFDGPKQGSAKIWKGLARVWQGFGKGLTRVWQGNWQGLGKEQGMGLAENLAKPLAKETWNDEPLQSARVSRIKRGEEVRGARRRGSSRNLTSRCLSS